MSRLFDTEVKIAYSASMDEFSVACGYRNMKITDEFLVKGYYRCLLYTSPRWWAR